MLLVVAYYIYPCGLLRSVDSLLRGLQTLPLSEAQLQWRQSQCFLRLPVSLVLRWAEEEQGQ